MILMISFVGSEKNSSSFMASSIDSTTRSSANSIFDSLPPSFNERVSFVKRLFYATFSSGTDPLLVTVEGVKYDLRDVEALQAVP